MLRVQMSSRSERDLYKIYRRIVSNRYARQNYHPINISSWFNISNRPQSSQTIPNEINVLFFKWITNSRFFPFEITTMYYAPVHSNTQIHTVSHVICDAHSFGCDSDINLCIHYTLLRLSLFKYKYICVSDYYSPRRKAREQTTESTTCQIP